MTAPDPLWDYAFKVCLFVLTLGVGTYGYFLRRIMKQIDDSIATQTRTYELAQAAKGESERALKAADAAAATNALCRQRHDDALSAAKREITQDFVRKEDMQHVMRQLGKIEGMVMTLNGHMSGVVSTTQGIKDRLDEGNDRFERLETHVDNQNTRLSRLEGAADKGGSQ